MKLIFVRHGQTEENIAKIIQGQIHGKLSQIGIEQARATAEKLKGEKIDAVYVSELARAKDTAYEIMKFHAGVQLEYLPELKERHYGNLQGKKLTSEELKKLKEDQFTLGFRFPGGESTEEFYERIYETIKKIYQKHKNDTVLIVSHYGVGITLSAILDNLNIEKALKRFKTVKNGEVLVFNLNKMPVSILKTRRKVK